MTNFTQKEILENQLNNCGCSDPQDCSSCFKLLNLIKKENIEIKIKFLKNELIDLKELKEKYRQSNHINHDIISLLNRLENEKNKDNDFINILNKYRIKYDKNYEFNSTNKKIEQKNKQILLLLDERSRIIQKIKSIK